MNDENDSISGFAIRLNGHSIFAIVYVFTFNKSTGTSTAWRTLSTVAP